MATCVVLIQSASLFRILPTNPACGRVLNLIASLNVLINCDSAVFMKDAQSPERLFDGQSVYQDRPGHALLVWIMSSFLKVFGFPNISREVVGNSGDLTLYQSAFYFSFLVINLLVLLLSVKLALGFVYSGINKHGTYSNAIIILIVTFIVAGNELTKTFFWTPHSQMFNILLPVIALVLLNNLKRIDTLQLFVSLTLGLVMLMFFYPLFGILSIVLIFSSYSQFWKRALIVFIALFGYLLYPKALEFAGGSYSNYAILNFRQYVWILDAAKQDNIVERSTTNVNSFISTVPLIPSLLLLTSSIVLYVVAVKAGKKSAIVNLEYLPYLLFLIVYLVALLAMGYYSRRLTLGPFIFLELFMLRIGILILGSDFQKRRFIATHSLLLLLAGSWFWTNGPLS